MKDLYIPAHDDQGRRIPYDVSGDFQMVFTVDLDAWSPRPALYRLAVEAAEATASRIPSAQQVYAALRARGFPEAKRRGVWGFKGLSVPANLPTARLVQQTGTAAAYYRRHDRSPAAREAVFATRAMQPYRHDSDGTPVPSVSPWYEQPWSAADQAEFSRNNRKRPRRHR